MATKPKMCSWHGLKALIRDGYPPGNIHLYEERDTIKVAYRYSTLLFYFKNGLILVKMGELGTPHAKAVANSFLPPDWRIQGREGVTYLVNQTTKDRYRGEEVLDIYLDNSVRYHSSLEAVPRE
jgi:hypothetical protein